MTPQSDPALTLSLKSFSRGSSVFAILIGCLVLVGWAFDIIILKSVLPGLVTMKANTAMGFVLMGISLWLLQPDPTDQVARRIGRLGAGMAALIALLTMSEYLFGWNLGIDQLLFKELPEAAKPFPPDRMTPATALNFLLLASALLLLDVEKRSICYSSQSLTLMAGLISLLSLGAYIYKYPTLIGGFSYTRMSLHTAPTFIILCSGILCARPDPGLMVVITSDSTGGLLARRLLPAAIVVPLLLAWLRLEGERAGLYSLEFGLALFALSNVVIFAALIWWNAGLLHQTDAERKGAEQALRQRVEEIQSLHEIGQTIINSVDLKTITERILDKVLTIGPFDVGVVRLLEPNGKMFLPVSSRGYQNPENIRPLTPDPKDPSFGRAQAEVFARNGGFIVESVPASVGFRTFKAEGVESAVVVPIRAGDKIIGTIQLGTRAPRKFKPEEIRLLETIGDQLGIAVQKIRLFEGTLKRADELTLKTLDLDRANKAKDEFLSIMSHELRTPLNVILGYTGLLRDGMFGGLNPEQADALKAVMNQSKDLLSLVSDILRATQIGSGQVEAQMSQEDLTGFLDELKTSYDLPLSKELTLQWDYPPDLPAVYTDGEKLRQILQNLINNAIKFTEKGAVTVSARAVPGNRQQQEDGRQQEEERTTASCLMPTASQPFVEFKVADTGRGIAQESLPIVFELFRQADSSETRPYGGAGLGLYIVKKYTELLGGTVDVESEVGRGTTFTVTIPYQI